MNPEQPDPILELLAESPGLKANQIAERLKLERREVNSLLYGRLKGFVRQDSRYNWFLRPHETSVASTDPGAEAKSDTPLSRLCTYYLSCLAHDDTNGVSVFARDKYGRPDYVELAQHPLIEDLEGDPFDSEGARHILGRLRGDRGRSALYLGFPIRVRCVRSRTGWEGCFVEPIILIPFDTEETRYGARPELQPEFITLNAKALESLVAADSGNVLDEVILLTEELGLDQVSWLEIEPDELYHRLFDLRSGWDWKERADLFHPDSEPPIAAIEKEGIYNRVILVRGERSPYTQGLETELKKLSALGRGEYRGTALADWVDGALSPGKVPKQEPLLEVLALNGEQRQAVLQSLQQPLTVITGPPGTGKSQVVTSILVNAAWQGTRVLFASKNHKAVDVVEVRANGLGPRPVVLRLGRNEHQEQLADYLTQLLSATATVADQARYRETVSDHNEVRRAFEALDEELISIVELRNQVDELEQAVEQYRRQLGPGRFRILAQVKAEELKPLISSLKAAVDAADRDKQGFMTRLLWSFIASRRVELLADSLSRTGSLLTHLGAQAPPTPEGDGAVAACRRYAEEIESRMAAAEQIQRYFSGLRRLQAAPSLESLAQQRVRLIERLADTSMGVWEGWLRLQPSRLSPTDRRRLGDFTGMLRLIVQANEDGTRLGAKVFREYYRMFPQITGMLPCWATTSLSARRLPFEPGFFDLLVIDEASQCDIASALPLLYRAKRAAVIGDPMQLRHISKLPEKQDRALLAKHDLLPEGAGWSYSVTSLYDRASTLGRSEDLVSLRDHHRSHAAIIRFSNDVFYEGRLRVATKYNRLRRVANGEPAVIWRNVEGTVQAPRGRGAVNRVEAEAVVRELERIVLDQGYEGTVGAVSPFRAQANLIRELVQNHSDLGRQVGQMEFLADTVHAFQGDERDLMVFSPVLSNGIARGAEYFLSRNPNLFNVAITRARASLIVVGDVNAALHGKVDYLRKFAEYAQSVRDQEQAIQQRSTVDLGAEYPSVAKPNLVSEWERVLYRALFANGLRPVPQYEVEQYILDFAFFDRERRLNVEVDGERYHRSWDGELCRRDQIRNQRLIELGWDVMRFWVYEVRDDLEGCVQRILRWRDPPAERKREEGDGQE